MRRKLSFRAMQFIALVLCLLLVLVGVPSGNSLAKSKSAHTALPKRVVELINYQGFVDAADCNQMVGWAADRDRLNTAINVSIFDGTTLLTTQLANLPRSDVGAQIGDNGLHGFQFIVPAALKDGRLHSLHVHFESSSTELTNSPRSLTCAPPVTPRDDTANAIVLNLEFKLNGGATSTTTRNLTVSFTAKQVVGTVTTDITRNITHYRIRESPNAQDSSLSAEPWLPVTRAIFIDLALRNASNQRYGPRRVMFQVKNGDLTSNVAGASINLDPVLKEYRVSSSGNTHPLIQYASSQGFTFPLDFYETCKGDCPGSGVADPSLGTGAAGVFLQATMSSGDNSLACGLTITAAILTLGMAAPLAVLVCTTKPAEVPVGTCRTKVDYLLFQARSPNQYWRIKSVDVPGTHVVFAGANRFRVKGQFDNTSLGCIPGIQIAVGDVVVEGPEVDDFVDNANPWKNAFVRPLVLQRPPGFTFPH